MPTPQLILSLSPEDQLTVELPGAFATRRKIELGSNPEMQVATLLRILRAQRHETGIEIGQDGAPTTRQVRHWERHETFPDTKCPFCWADGRFAEGAGSKRIARKELVSRGSDGVEVRRIKPKESGLGPTVSQKGLSDIGL